MSGPIPYSDSSSSISSQRKSSTSWTSQARNPVSLRLYKVLGTNFDDEATREALQTLSELYVNSSSSGSTVDASSKVKETPKSNAHFDGALLEDGEDEDDDEEERAQSSIGTSKLVENTPGEAAARARKNLKRDMELRLAEGSRHFLKILSEVDEVGRDSQLEVSTIMREGVRRLRKRPELLNESLAALLLTRQTTLTSSFLTALTRGGPSGLPRPIELHAHDPLRYIGDMLAWVHQAIAAEREFLEALFSIKEDGFREPILRSLSHAPDAALRYSRERTDQTDSNLYLFIVTTNHVLVHQATGRGTGSSAVMVVDEIGAGLGCAVMNESNMIVARDEAIYMCAIEGRGNAFDYEGNKSAIHVHSSYLVIISPPFVASAFAASTTVCNFIRATGDDISEISKVTVFDHANKFVAYSGTFSQGLTHLIEKSTSAKLDMLYKRSLYGLALNLAKTKNVDDSHVEDIHRQYGDHLYPSKNDYDGAMTQYVKTLGWVQPSSWIPNGYTIW
ncbi:hypothetical protein HHX47_DHR2000129 [Lentinula edodes]|nr:hypothetical protein HHX47_DHR2000129 [Lentinula edodes]